MEVRIKPQNEFPKLEEYKKHFKVTEKTIFAYDNCIYTNYELPTDILIHEIQHLKQQERDGLEFWLTNYLNDTNYRLKQETDAYRVQLASIKDRNLRAKIRIESSKNLSSDLYGGIISNEEALNILK